MSITGTSASTQAVHRRYEPYMVRVEDYVSFHKQGFLLVPILVPREDVQELIDHMNNLLAGRETIPGIAVPSFRQSPQELLQYWLRIHMLHRVLPIHERFLLHPRILDVLEALICPDVLVLQSRLFFKQPAQPGQDSHQDSYYLAPSPDTLCGAWLALDRADEENGCLLMTVGSQHEPVYLDSDGDTNDDNRELGDVGPITTASHTGEAVNGLTPVASKYPGREVKAPVDPGDVIFFGRHIMHRSHSNRSKTRLRRAFVGHHCNALSWIPLNLGAPYEGQSANYLRIGARGTTHQPHVEPHFGTPCVANRSRTPVSRSCGGKPMSMMDDGTRMVARLRMQRRSSTMQTLNMGW